MNTPSLEVKNLAVSYQTARGLVQAVQDVSFVITPGQMTAIVGESGSGKSTTAQAMIGLLAENGHISAGSISLGERDLSTLTAQQWRQLRGTTIGLIPQDPNNSLNPVQTIGASVGEGLAINTKLSPAARKKRVLELLADVGIDEPERRYRQYPHELSGGMKQRVLIAAALALEPDFIIADEPTSALDVTVQKVILDLLDRMRVEKNIGVLFITHDLAVAGDRAQNIVVMQHGKVREHGIAASVLASPKDSYTRQLLSDAPSLAVASAIPHRARPEGDLILSVDNFSQRFGDFTAVEGVSFDVRRGTTHAIVGESGSGKTTTGRAIAGFTTPAGGSITLNGDPVKVGSREYRKRVQMVYQNPYSSLDPRQTIGSTIAEPLKNFKLASGKDIQERVARYLELVSLDPDLASRRPVELSGGQRQRVAIARALIVEPDLVVLDEAISALDVTVQSQILHLLDRLQEQLGLTYVFISHDLAVVRKISDTVSVLSRGKQEEYGLTSEVFENPQTRYTRTLIDAIPGKSFRSGILNLGL